MASAVPSLHMIGIRSFSTLLQFALATIHNDNYYYENDKKILNDTPNTYS